MKISGIVDSVHKYPDHYNVYINNALYKLTAEPFFTNNYNFTIVKKGDIVKKDTNDDKLSVIHEGEKLLYFRIKEYN